MRILAIRGCNLASLAGEFAIDLADGPLGGAGVFAIVGPTGAGKSTLLDAMCVALFDRTPRLANRSTVVVGKGDDDPTALGAQDVRTLLRRGATAGWAEVDFESGDARRYRARWSVRRARGSTAGTLQDQQVTLTAISGGERFGGTKMETLRAIHQRLGLTFDQFRRSALLAQGDFSAFLRADGKDRSELLERMTGTEIYSKLSVAAHVRAALAEQQLRERQGAAFAIAVLAPEARAAAEAELVLANQAREASRTRLAAAELIARWSTEAVARQGALVATEREHLAAQAAVTAAEPARSELALRRRAEALRGAWDRVTRIDREHSIARTEHAAAGESVEAARKRGLEIGGRRARIAELHEPIRAARIAAGIVEQMSSRGSRPDIETASRGSRPDLVQESRGSGSDIAAAASRGSRPDLVPAARGSRSRLASGTDASSLIAGDSTNASTLDTGLDQCALDAGDGTDAIGGAGRDTGLDQRALDAGDGSDASTISGAGRDTGLDRRALDAGDGSDASTISGASRDTGLDRRVLDTLAATAFDVRALDAAERAGQGALESALWLAERRALAPEIAAWSELDTKLGQYRTLADSIAASDAAIGEHSAARGALAAKQTALVALRDAAREHLEIATREAERFLARRTLTLDAAGRAEDDARARATEVEKLVAIAAGAAAAARARAELAVHTEELERAVAGEAERRVMMVRERDTAATLRDERARVVADMRRIAGFDHARGELVEGDPCPLCGAEEHPWQARGAVDEMIGEAERSHVEAASRWNIAVATLAQLEARVAAREADRTRIASARAVVDAEIGAAATTWRAHLAALGELVLVEDPATREAAELAQERAELARTRLEAARRARSEAVAAAKAIADAQARVQVCQAEHDHHQTALRALAAELGRVDAAVERLAGERASKVERHLELVRELATALARWTVALPAAEAAQLGITIAAPAQLAVVDVFALVPDGGADASALGISPGGVASGAPPSKRARTKRAPAGKQDTTPSTAAVTVAGTSSDSAGKHDTTAAVTVAVASSGSDRAPAGKHDTTATVTVAVASSPSDRGGVLGSNLTFDREALRAVVAAWRARADIVAAADAALASALADVERAIASAERAVAEATTREAELGKRAHDLGAQLAAAATALDGARIAANFERDALPRLLAESVARVDELAAELAELDRAVDRARTRVGERRRLVDDHEAAKPSAATIDAAGPSSHGVHRDGAQLVIEPAVLEQLATAVAAADHHAAAVAATLAADADARARRDAALAQFAAAERAAEIDRVLGEVIGSHDGKLFRSFAQSLTLDGLLAVANSHLEELAPRYQLERVPKHDLELQVIDRDFGSEVRSVQSLSGGESFLVSLALALGLSSMSAHDVRVRTLLIDEGFGTLDPATLDSALAVLDALQATGRQVGVISHVPALIDRVRAHVRVLPKGGGRSEVIVPPS